VPTTDHDPPPPEMAAGMRKATRLTRSGRLHEATEVIQRTLRRGMPTPAPGPASRGPSGPTPDPESPTWVDAEVLRTERSAPTGPTRRARPGPASGRAEDRGPSVGAVRGAMHRGTAATAAGTREYRVHVPAGVDGTGAPLIVMLHGCTQGPEDLAVGTRMNALADRHGLVVAYPEQSRQANPQACWNWFQPVDQQRDGGEPEVIAEIVRRVAATFGTDGARTYVAGMSAGAAMAVVLGRTHPDLFAAVGAHSGLPHGAATDLSSALRAMRQGAAAPSTAGRGIPTIVFHGDRDATVHRANAEAILRQATAGAARPLVTVHERPSGARRAHTRYVYRDASGTLLAEGWSVHGLGHAWSGGDPAGTYTDADGPDASAELVRFFAEHRRG
jgi:poly(hydroxyalkanoate) depolymerase family esterase